MSKDRSGSAATTRELNATSGGPVGTRHVGRSLILLVFFLVGGYLAYRQAVATFFLSDDFGIIFRVVEFGLGSLTKRLDGTFFRPTVSFSLLADHLLWGLRPAGYHLTNVLLHGVSAWIVYLLGSRLRPHNGNSTTLAPLGAGLFFLVMPNHSEAVDWVAARTDLIAALLTLASLLLYLDARARDGRGRRVLSVTLFVLGAMAKESAYVLPVLLLAWEALALERTEVRTALPRAVGRVAPFISAAVACFAIRWLVVGSPVGGYGARVHLHFHWQVVTQNLVAYSLRSLLPPLPAAAAAWLSDHRVLLLGALVLGGGLACFLAWWRGRPAEAFLLLATPIALVPVITLGVSLFNTQNERQVYLPSAFAALLFASALDRVVADRTVLVGGLAVLLVACALDLSRRNHNWYEAGEVAREILAQLDATAGNGRLFILALPDNLDGAYVFRNGLREAVGWFCPHFRFAGGTLVGRTTFATREESVRVSVSGDQFTVSQTPSQGGFARSDLAVPPTLANAYRVTRWSPDGFTVSIPGLTADDAVVVYTGRALVRVAPQQPTG